MQVEIPRSLSHITLNQRQLRVGELLKRILSSFFSKPNFQSKVPNCSMMIVTEVRMSADLRHALVFILPFQIKDFDIEQLQNLQFYIRKSIRKQISFKYIPSIQFKLDDSLDKAKHIDKLLSKV